MKQNKDDVGVRRYFLVQLPEAIAEDNRQQRATAGFLADIDKPLNVAEITKERLRRASSALRSNSPKSDFGFRVFKLDSSNVNSWDLDRANMADSLLDHVDHIKPDRSEGDLLYELLLKLGYDLCETAEERSFAGKRVTAMADGSLMTCLTESIKGHEVEGLIAGMAAWRDELQPEQDVAIVFRDSAFEDDKAKTNAVEVLKQHGIKDVRSI